MTLRELYTNSPHGKRDFALNFFHHHATQAVSAQLACPFFTSAGPLKILRAAGCDHIQLVVRLCSATLPGALDAVRQIGGINIRYFTSEAFHAKFYLLGSIAMIGSANLTEAGMMTNREVAITLLSSDEVFDELPALFDELWQSASVLTDDALQRFASWYRSSANIRLSDEIDGIEPSSPVTVNVDTQIKTRERTYLESFRREYYETLIPSYREVREVYLSTGSRHTAFGSLPIEYEIDRFLNWAKLTFTTDETIHTFSARKDDDRRSHIQHHINQWFAVQVSIDLRRANRLADLKKIFATPQDLSAATFDELTEALLGCAAFDEQLRFTRGGEQALAKSSSPITSSVA